MKFACLWMIAIISITPFVLSAQPVPLGFDSNPLRNVPLDAPLKNTVGALKNLADLKNGDYKKLDMGAFDANVKAIITSDALLSAHQIYIDKKDLDQLRFNIVGDCPGISLMTNEPKNDAQADIRRCKYNVEEMQKKLTSLDQRISNPPAGKSRPTAAK